MVRYELGRVVMHVGDLDLPDIFSACDQQLHRVTYPMLTDGGLNVEDRCHRFAVDFYQPVSLFGAGLGKLTPAPW